MNTDMRKNYGKTIRRYNKRRKPVDTVRPPEKTMDNTN